MKILLQSTVFYPSVGGIETVTQCLASHYVAQGNGCTVLTRSVLDVPDQFSFAVSRNPSLKEKMQLIRSHDIVHCNGASLELVFLAKLLGKPIVWTHAGYQLVSIDGLGWYEGEASPLSPLASIRYHLNRQGWKKGLIEALKLQVRRLAASFVQHVAITKWVANRQPFSNQVIIYNPFPLDRFAKISTNESPEYDFFFLGRLVSEKGVATLLKAFSLFLEQERSYSKKLLIIGDGNWRNKLEDLATKLGIAMKVDFVGRQTGDALLYWVAKGKVAIIPSQWEEPMGGVALEMLAAGKPVIVSENGGLAECVGNAGLLFPNGDAQELAKQMVQIYTNLDLFSALRHNAKAQAAKFNEEELTQQYLTLFEKLLPNLSSARPS